MIYYLPLQVAAFAISIIVGIMSWQKRHSEGGLSLFALMTSLSIWTFGSLCELVSIDLPSKFIWVRFEYLGIVFLPVASIYFSFEFSKKYKLLNRGKVLLFLIIPVINLVMVWTNPLHGLFYKDIAVQKFGDLHVFVPTFGPWFLVHTVYSYILILISTVLFIIHGLRLPRVYRSQAITFIFAALFPFAGNILSITKIINVHVDLTPLMFIVSGTLLFLGSTKYKMADLIPVAHRLVVNNIKDIILVLDNKSRIIYINNEGKNTLGLSDDKIIGQYSNDILKEWDELAIRYKYVNDVREEITLSINNHPRVFNITISPLINEKGVSIGRIINLHDITELKELMNKLGESQRAAEAASIAKSQFLANMSHEIRTPMNGVIGMLELALGTELTEEQTEYVTIAKSSADDLLKIINDILDFSKVEAGKLELEEKPFNLEDTILSVVKLLITRAKEKRLNLGYFIDEDVPVNLIGDSIRLRQILINLIGNALKFTNHGSVNIYINKLQLNACVVELSFSVKDTGIGIPSDKIDKLFKSFSQADNSSTRKYGGTGLGLVISKQLVEMMGGMISVSSLKDIGSTFTFTAKFQLQKDLGPYSSYISISDKEIASDLTAETVITRDTKENISILLVEDNPTNRKLATIMLEKNGWSVHPSANGIEAMKALKNNSFDIILMDVQMPEMDGLETTKLIREGEKATQTHIPIIAMTAHSLQEDRDQCMSAGMDDYISKPISKERLSEVIMKNVN